MKISKFAAALILGGLVFVAGANPARACDDDWLQVRQAVGPTDQTRARLMRDMRAGFDNVPLELTLTTIQSRTGVVFSVHWDELAGYGLTKSTPVNLMPWRIASVNKTVHDILGAKIKDRPVLSIDPDGKVRLPGVKHKPAPVSEQVAVKTGAAAGAKKPTAPATMPGTPEDAQEEMPDSGPMEPGQIAGAGDEGAPVMGPEHHVVLPVEPEKPSPATAVKTPEAPIAPAGPAAPVAPEGPALAATEPAKPEAEKTEPKSEVSNTGKFVEILPYKEAQTPVSENEKLIAELTHRGVRFNPMDNGSGLVAKLAPGVLSDDILAKVAKVKGVVELHVGDCAGGTQVSDAGLDSIGSMTGLTGLLFRQEGTTTKGFKNIGKLTQLKWLDLGFTNLTEKDFEVVAGLPKLESLWLHRMPLASENVALLAKSRSLKAMQLDVSLTLDEWAFLFDDLAKIPNLQDLTMPAINISVMERGLKKLKLKEITLDSKGTTDDHVEVIAGIPTLESVTLWQPTQVTAKGYAMLTMLPKLTEFKATKLKDETPLRPLGNIKTLEKLNLEGLEASGTTIDWVAGLTNLKELNLYKGHFGDDDLLKLKGLTGLTSLYLSANENLTDKGMAALAGMTKLEKLFICGTKVSDASLPALLTLKSLTRLDICHTQVTDEGVAKLAGMASLTELMLGGKSTDKVLDSLAKVKSLKLLEIRGSKLTPAGLNTLRAASPDLRIKSWT